MSRDFKKELAGFEKLWKRVSGSRIKMPENLHLMPKKSEKGKNPGRKPGI